MKGIRHVFLRECKTHKAKIKIGHKWQCRRKEIEVPEQKTDIDLFFGFHELGHYVLHRFDKRNYDDLLTRIQIEQEADAWANERMKEYGYPAMASMPTYALISLYLYEGGSMPPYITEIEDRFITLFKVINGHPFELFAQFISNLPMHPTVY